MGKRIKYMGSADVRIVDEGEDWGGRLSTPLKNRLVFSRQNNRTVDTDEAGLSAAAVSLLLEDPLFMDVSDMDLVPAGLNEQLFYGIPGTPDFQPPTQENEDLTVGELQDRLEILGLPKTGKKAELLQRLAEAQSKPALGQDLSPPPAS